MPTWLSDPTTFFYIVALILALVGVGMWYKSRDKGSAYRAGVLVGALVLVGVIDLLVESPREESVRKIEELTAAVNEKNKDKFFENVSDSFEYKTWKKEQLKSELWGRVEKFNPKASSKTDREDVQEPTKTNSDITIGFTSRVEAGGVDLPIYIRATFTKDPDGKWRLKGIVVFDDPVKKEKGTEIDLTTKIP